MKIKICGIKTLDDALIAIDAGAEMLGFNFYPSSPRYIEPERCTRLVAVLRETAPHITTVGVFVNTPPGEVDAILTTCGLDLAQLCGDEPPEALVALNGRAFKALRPQGAGMQEDAGAPDATVEALLQAGRYARRTPPALLVDAASPGAQYGGSGRVAVRRTSLCIQTQQARLDEETFSSV